MVSSSLPCDDSMFSPDMLEESFITFPILRWIRPRWQSYRTSPPEGIKAASVLWRLPLRPRSSSNPLHVAPIRNPEFDFPHRPYLLFVISFTHPFNLILVLHPHRCASIHLPGQLPAGRRERSEWSSVPVYCTDKYLDP